MRLRFIAMNRRSDVVCVSCGKTENLPNSRAVNYKYCSKECMSIAFLNKRIPIIGEKINKWIVVDSAVLRKYGRAYIRVRCSCENKTEFDLPYSHLDSKKSLGCKKCSRSFTCKGFEMITGTFWAMIKSGAEKRGIEFNLNIKDMWELYLKQDGKCALSGVSINFEPATGKHESLRTCSLDRIDSEQGYINGNVQWVHKDINIMKNRFDENYFKNMISKIMLNQKISVKVKSLHPDSKIPQYAKHGDAGMDLTATSKSYDEHGNVCYGTGLAFEIPHGYVGLLFPRSSNTKKDLILGNSVGVIDSGYRGEVVFKFKATNWCDSFSDYKLGDRIGQIIIMPYPQIEFNLVDELSSSDRGVGAFGSTDPITKSIEVNCGE